VKTRKVQEKAQKSQERILNAVRLEAQGLHDQAEREYRAALAITPRDVAALGRLGMLLVGRREFAKAAALFRRASLADPTNVIVHINLGAALLKLGDEDGAAAAYADALAVDPTSYDARLNLALRLLRQGQVAESRAHYQTLVDQNPRDRLARWNVAAIDALMGDLDAAFAGFAHEHTMKAPDIPDHLPRWRGEALGGRTLLLEAEQGFGDTIMFVRLAGLARRHGGKVLLRPQPELLGLVSRMDVADVYLPRNAPTRAEVWCSLGDLPGLFGAARSIAAAPGAYLSADPARRLAWEGRLPDTRRLRVGLVWAGNPNHADDDRRSMPLQILLGPLAAIDGVELVSLQKGAPAAEADGSPLSRVDLEIADFEDTAAVLERLDLLITVDTGVLHLAGALGRPVWGLLAFVPDWRWMLDRSDSPWYPSLRLFRQPRRGDWPSVVTEVAAALRALTSTTISRLAAP
jgi:Flp pilus assembly protein TadD